VGAGGRAVPAARAARRASTEWCRRTRPTPLAPPPRGAMRRRSRRARGPPVRPARAACARRTPGPAPRSIGRVSASGYAHGRTTACGQLALCAHVYTWPRAGRRPPGQRGWPRALVRPLASLGRQALCGAMRALCTQGQRCPVQVLLCAAGAVPAPFARQTSQEALERDPRRPPGGKRATGERSAPCRSGRATRSAASYHSRSSAPAPRHA